MSKCGGLSSLQVGVVRHQGAGLPLRHQHNFLSQPNQLNCQCTQTVADVQMERRGRRFAARAPAAQPGGGGGMAIQPRFPVGVQVAERRIQDQAVLLQFQQGTQ